MELTLVSRGVEESPTIRNYVLGVVANPDTGSAFANATAQLRSAVPASQWISLLLSQHYNGVVYRRGGEILGHVFWQYHATAVHIFSVFVSEKHRNCGLAEEMIRALLRYYRQPNYPIEVREVILGAGGSESMIHILQRIRGDQSFCSELRCRVELNRHCFVIQD